MSFSRSQLCFVKATVPPPSGLLSSMCFPGYTHDNDCMYINGTGQDAYEFYIQVRKYRLQERGHSKLMLSLGVVLQSETIGYCCHKNCVRDASVTKN